tara:strand:- start:239 stop:706 length:468 start_codon:yes stop_codon:yes gene_type:complete
MPEKAIPMTKKGLDNLGREIKELKSRRKDIAETIHTAQEHGTSQNDAEYEHAKQEQSMLEGKIRELEETIRRSTLIDEKKVQGAGIIVIGSGVQIENNGKRIHYKIVGTPEADVAQGLISNESPIGSALLGHKVGETVDVKVPSGIQTIKIVNID